MRKQKIRKRNLEIILSALFKRTAMPYTLLFYAEDIAEETLSDVIYVNNVPIFSTDYKKPQYAKNRRLILRSLKRKSEIKPYKTVLKKDGTWRVLCLI